MSETFWAGIKPAEVKALLAQQRAARAEQRVLCCVCSEPFKLGDQIVVTPSWSVAVHEERCTYLMPHHALSERERAELKSMSKFKLVDVRIGR